jgi:uncharacterized coiled-coil DUF342 family protein
VRRAPILLLAIAVAAGCGGGGGGGERLTREEYAKKADSICGKFNQQTKDLKVSNMSELVAAVDKTTPVLDKALRQLRALKPPENEQATADRWLAQIEKLKSDLKDIRDKASANDLAGVQTSATRAQQDNSKGNQLATQLGMTVCSTG